MPDFKSNVEKILAAEKDRANLISEAKNRKQSTLKQAKVDAEETLKEYSLALEMEIKEKNCLVKKESAEQEEEIQALANTRLEEAKNVQMQKKREVVEMLAHSIFPVR